MDYAFERMREEGAPATVRLSEPFEGSDTPMLCNYLGRAELESPGSSWAMSGGAEPARGSSAVAAWVVRTSIEVRWPSAECLRSVL